MTDKVQDCGVLTTLSLLSLVCTLSLSSPLTITTTTYYYMAFWSLLRRGEISPFPHFVLPTTSYYYYHPRVMGGGVSVGHHELSEQEKVVVTKHLQVGKELGGGERDREKGATMHAQLFVGRPTRGGMVGMMVVTYLLSRSLTITGLISDDYHYCYYYYYYYYYHRENTQV